MPDTKKRNEKGLTERQERFLVAYAEILDVYKAAKIAGIHRSNIMADLKRDTPFAEEFRELSESVDNDPRLTKAGSVGRLLQMIEQIDRKLDREDELYDENMDVLYAIKTKLDLQKEINKMIEGHLVSQKKVVENRNLILQGTYDFTKGGMLPEAPVQKELSVDTKPVKTISVNAEE